MSLFVLISTLVLASIWWSRGGTFVIEDEEKDYEVDEKVRYLIRRYRARMILLFCLCHSIMLAGLLSIGRDVLTHLVNLLSS